MTALVDVYGVEKDKELNERVPDALRELANVVARNRKKQEGCVNGNGQEKEVECGREFSCV